MFGWLTQLTHYSCEFTSPWLCWFRLLFLQYLEEAPKMVPANFITFSLRHPCSGFFGIPRWCCLKFVNCKILLFIICPCTWPQNGGKSAMLIMLRQDKKNCFRLAILTNINNHIHHILSMSIPLYPSKECPLFVGWVPPKSTPRPCLCSKDGAKFSKCRMGISPKASNLMDLKLFEIFF